MVTKNSDYDGRMVVKDKVFKSYKEKYENLKNKEIEL
jgi:hypothetical protein